MKELSFLMLLIALIATGLAWAERALKLNQERYAAFYIPDVTRFNVVWGFIFYTGYGAIIAQKSWICYIFIILIVILFLYLIYLYAMRRFLLGNCAVCAHILKKVVLMKISKQQKIDNSLKNCKYPKEKALKMLGIPAFADGRAKLIQTRLEVLKNQNFSHPYFDKLVKNIENSIYD
jgi:hypothetical protein